MTNKRLIRRATALITTALLALVLTSCGDDDEKEKPMKESMMMDDSSTSEAETMMDSGMAQKAGSAMDVRALRSAIRGIVSSPMLSRWLLKDTYVSEFVRLVVNINQSQTKQSLNDFEAFQPSAFKPLMIDNQPYLGSTSFNRYNQLARLVDGLDARSLVDLLDRTKQLTQAEYSRYGIPASRGDFKEQLKRAMDKVIAVNVSQNRIPLSQDSVLHKFESSSLERASDVEKLMYRMGPRNSRLIQVKLREVRGQM